MGSVVVRDCGYDERVLPPADAILTKILATLGPSCGDPQTLAKLVQEGVRVVRINFSHGTFDDFERSLHAAREAERLTGLPVGVLGDLSGPKLRLTRIEGGSMTLDPGDRVEFITGDAPGRRDGAGGLVTLTTTYDTLIEEVEAGQRVLIDDGAVRMLATECHGAGCERKLTCRVTVGGPISDKKGVNLPDTELSAPSLTDWDRECAAWAIEHGVDYLALSFVRRGADVRELRELVRTLWKARHAGGTDGAVKPLRPPIVAKIEKPQALAEIEAICDAADALMVARGDLGVEMDLAQVPVLQKRIISTAHDWGKPVIVATQMLQSMIERPSPTRAEASDVANAVIDGADAVMLSGETAVGGYPLQAVATMNRIAREAEGYVFDVFGRNPRPPKRLQETRYRTAALAHGVSVIARDLGARYVVTWSELGGTARYLSQNRLKVPVLAVSSSPAVLRQMALLFGIRPVHMDRPESTDEFLDGVDRLLLDNAWCDAGDPIVLVMGEPLGTPGVTNQVRIHYVGDVCRVSAS